MSKKYPWADNKIKLQRAIERANIESLPLSQKEERVKQLYISFGGHVVELQEDNQNKTMENEEVLPSEEAVLDADTSADETPLEEKEPTASDLEKVEEEGTGLETNGEIA